MSDQFRRAGNFLFHTRNALFPIFLITLLFIWPPVAIGNTSDDFLLLCGLLLIISGQAIRIVTIGLAYIVRGGRKRSIYAENLVTDGIFAHSRNPMYVGNVLISIGFLAVAGNPVGMLVGSAVILVIYRLIVHSEECFLNEEFAEGYQAYCKDVPRWLPKMQGLQATIHDYKYKFDWPGVAVKEYGTLFASAIVPLVLIAWKLYVANLLGEYKILVLGLAVLVIVAYAGIRILKKTDRLMSLRDPRYKGNN